MKKFLLSVLALLAIAFGATAQTLPSYVPANGLVGWWPFNGNANDESGNNNNGTVNGATLTIDRFGNAGKAYSFDGASNYIIISDNNSLDLVNQYSFSTWVYLPDYSLNQPNEPMRTILSKPRPDGGGGYSLRAIEGVSFSGGNTLSYVSGWNNGTINGGINSPDTIPLMKWTNIVFTYNGNEASLYKDGMLKASSTVSFSLLNSTFELFFGKEFSSNSVDSRWFNGSLDDIAIYNRALTQQEITALYQGANTTTNCPTFPASLAQGLVGYWPFCGNANDESGNGNNGTVNGATLTTDRFGNAGKAYSFDGNGDYIGASSNNLPSAERTISIWFNGSSFLGGPALLGYGGNGCGSSFFVAINQPPIPNVIINQSHCVVDSLTSPFSINDTNSWHHLVITTSQNGTNHFIDGQKTAENSTFISNTYVSNRDFAIGSNVGNDGYMPWVDANQTWWKGSLDDIAIWNRALSQSEITQLYNQGICQTSITVTDTLLIHTGITSYNPVAYGNTLKVWPNPGNQDITLDAGNLSSMQGWKYKVANTLGQTVVNETAISQQQTMIDLSNWGGNGIYYLHLINPQGHAIEIKKIVLAP
jgi:hypothetical protein